MCQWDTERAVCELPRGVGLVWQSCAGYVGQGFRLWGPCCVQEAQRDAERADMRAAKLDWMQRQKEAFRNRQQVPHSVVTILQGSASRVLGTHVARAHPA